jgi:hypothetical protein
MNTVKMGTPINVDDEDSQKEFASGSWRCFESELFENVNSQKKSQKEIEIQPENCDDNLVDLKIRNAKVKHAKGVFMKHVIPMQCVFSS